MKIELKTQEENTEVIQIGSIRVSAYLQDGKTVLVLTTLNAADCVIVMPTSNNQIVVKADKKII